MNTLFPQLKACGIAAAIATLTACGGGSDPVTTSDACKSGADTSFAQFDASTGKSHSVYAKDRDEDDDNENENDHDNDDRVIAATAPTTTAGTTDPVAPATSANCDTVATPTPAPSPAPAPTPTPAPTPAPSPAPAPAPAPASNNSVRGKALYSANCAACHGANPLQNISSILKGRNASTTLSAIANNKGGMGFLKSTIGASEATDIAIYLNAP